MNPWSNIVAVACALVIVVSGCAVVPQAGTYRGGQTEFGRALLKVHRDGKLEESYGSIHCPGTWIPVSDTVVLAEVWEARKHPIKCYYVLDRKTRTYDCRNVVWAASTGDLESLKQLAARGQSLDFQDEHVYAWTPLMAAISHGQTNITSYLLTRNVGLNLQDRKGETALMRAIRTEDTNTVRLLLDAGADTAVKDRNGIDALGEAETSPHREVLVKWLKKDEVKPRVIIEDFRPLPPDPSDPPVERRAVGPAAVGRPTATVICELRYYVVGSMIRPTPLRVTTDNRKGDTYSISEPFRLLRNADTNRTSDVRGFVLQVVSPSQYAGKILTVHFDGVGASGNPFEAFAFGRRYQMDVLPVAIGSLDFGLCY